MHGTNRPPFTADDIQDVSGPSWPRHTQCACNPGCMSCAPSCRSSGPDRPFGLPADSVERRDSLGRRIRQTPEFTLEQMERITRYYAETPAWQFDLSELAKEIGKSRHNICRYARRAGLTNFSRLASDKQKAAKRRPLSAKHRQALRKPKWQDKPHPRGMAGKKHTDATKARIAVASKTEWATQKTFGGPLVSEEASHLRSERMRAVMALRPAHKNYTNRNGGHREDLNGQYFRSSWEANYARYLNFLIKLGVVEHWKYEPDTFWFKGIKRGVTNYKPDFRVKFKGDEKLVYVEVKGQIVPKDKVKWRRMKKYYPQIILQIVASKEYYDIQKKWSSAIPTWEKKAPFIRSARR
jgi:hypothetical protein